jgi:electron transport complex protein RnfG
MKKALHMFAVLAGIALFSGLVLGWLNSATAQRAADNILRFKKVPAVVTIFEAGRALSPEDRTALEERLLREKRTVELGEEETLTVFVLEADDRPGAVTLEAFGYGYGGKLGVMVGFDLESGDLAGIGITTMSETPGVGTRVLEAAFLRQFMGLKSDASVKLKKDGGVVDAVTGATVSSRAVADAVDRARAVYRDHQEAIQTAIGEAAP